MPYRVYPDGTIETDTVEEILGVLRAIESDPLVRARYGSAKNPAEELKELHDELLKLVKEKARVDSEIELCMIRQRKLALGDPQPPSDPDPPPETIGFYAAIGREIHHLEKGCAYFGDRLVIYKWGETFPSKLVAEACTSSGALNLRGEISIVPLTKDHVEVFSAAREPVLYCSDFGIERPK